MAVASVENQGLPRLLCYTFKTQTRTAIASTITITSTLTNKNPTSMNTLATPQLCAIAEPLHQQAPRQLTTIALCILLAQGLSACGNKTPLYLPTPAPKTEPAPQSNTNKPSASNPATSQTP
jgi:predicted small lipoprotein YifL